MLGYPGMMPFKHNAARRHHIPKTRRHVRNWPAYEAGLQRRGDLTLWVDEATLAGVRRSAPQHAGRTTCLCRPGDRDGADAEQAAVAALILAGPDMEGTGLSAWPADPAQHR